MALLRARPLFNVLLGTETLIKTLNVNREVLIRLVIGCAGLRLWAGCMHTCKRTIYDRIKPLKLAFLRRRQTGSGFSAGHFHLHQKSTHHLPGRMHSLDPVGKIMVVVDCVGSTCVNLVACFDDPMWCRASHWQREGACKGTDKSWKGINIWHVTSLINNA